MNFERDFAVAAESLTSFSPVKRERILAILGESDFDGVLTLDAVEYLLGEDRETVHLRRLMLDLLPVARLFALAPTSDYQVGVVCQGESGSLYLGANLEIAGETLGLTVHAEQSAITNALVHGERRITHIALTAAPCGHCRQFLNELANASNLQVLIFDKQPTTLMSLLPDAFGPENLGAVRALLNHDTHQLVASEDVTDEVTKAALDASRRSYAPYTQAACGVALRTAHGTVVAAPYIESVAYNPSLSPLLSALSRLRFHRQSLSTVREIVLAELQKAPISQQAITELIAKSVAPDAEVRVLAITRQRLV